MGLGSVLGRCATTAALLTTAACAPAAVSVERAEVPVDDGGDAASPTTTTRAIPPPRDGAVRGIVEPTPATDDQASPTGSGVDDAGRAPGTVLVFGDSVAGLIVDDVARALPDRLVLDAVDCRRIDIGFEGPCGGVPAGVSVAPGLDDLRDAVDDLTAAGDLPDHVVLVLANNSSLRAADLDAAMEILSAVPHVVWVNTRIVGFGRQDPNNRLLDELTERAPRAEVVDWFGASAGRDWLDDHVHPDDDGQAALGGLVAAAIEGSGR